MKQKDTILGLTIDQSAERMQWLDSIVRDELTRPLVLSDEELHRVQFEENKMKKRLHKVTPAIVFYCLDPHDNRNCLRSTRTSK